MRVSKPEPHEVEQAVGGIEPDYDDGEADQRRHAVRRQYTVVDLQHVKRPGKAKDVDHTGEYPDGDQRPGTVPERRSQFIARN